MLSQPFRVKTLDTFKNPKSNTKKGLGINSESLDIKETNEMFGDAKLLNSNFLINQDNASSKDMKNLINFVKENNIRKQELNLN